MNKFLKQPNKIWLTMWFTNKCAFTVHCTYIHTRSLVKMVWYGYKCNFTNQCGKWWKNLEDFYLFHETLKMKNCVSSEDSCNCVNMWDSRWKRFNVWSTSWDFFYKTVISQLERRFAARQCEIFANTHFRLHD